MTTTTSWLQGNGMGSMGMGSLHQGVMAHTMYQAIEKVGWDDFLVKIPNMSRIVCIENVR
jgi:hypothetical protein